MLAQQCAQQRRSKMLRSAAQEKESSKEREEYSLPGVLRTLSPEYYVLRPSQPAEGDGYRESTFCGYVVRPAGSRFRDRRADPSTKTRVFCPGAARPRRTPAESEIHMPRSIQADHTTIATCPICGTNAPVLEDRAAGLLERWRREHAEHDEAERRDFAKEPG